MESTEGGMLGFYSILEDRFKEKREQLRGNRKQPSQNQGDRRAAGGNPLILFWFVSMVSRFCRVSLPAGSVSDGQTEHR